MTVCMLGVQFTWTVELGYGTPYLLSLGIPPPLTPLVWLAGPLSGLIVQPVVGVFSDTLDWKMGRRRPFILLGALLTILSMYMVAYAKELARWIVVRFLNSPDDDLNQTVKTWTIVFAIIGFYCLDFSINAVQASCRSLIMDTSPTDQQETCNAWSGWMNNLGSVVGFFAGNLDLVKYIPLLGDSQIKALANLAVLFFATGLGICCLSVKEIPYETTDNDKTRSVLSTMGNIWRAFRRLPIEIQRICNVQFFAWMGWFPFLFYSTTWIAEILNRVHQIPNAAPFAPTTSFRSVLHSDDRPHQPRLPSPADPSGVAERAGSFALLCWAGLAVVAGIMIPLVTPQKLGLERWPRNPFTLKNLWTMSLVWFAACMGMTWFVDCLLTATIVIALCGVPWAIALWVPFAMMGEILSNMKDQMTMSKNTDTLVSSPESPCSASPPPATISEYGAITTRDNSNITHAASLSSSNSAQTNDRDHDPSSPLLETGLTDMELTKDHTMPQLDAGLVLGVHNMYIVFPQFVDALIASCLFAMIGAAPTHDQPSPKHLLPEPGNGDVSGHISFLSVINPEPVGWILRFGGLMALVAAYLSRRL
ncbi:MAG: hypothetical protein BYD32DRAFT_442981 [Podila humilis]|nr:MAG: hypothetical protein BYD32DRAFT_442981 [Podila humilis]